jgi:hypothetical protein
MFAVGDIVKSGTKFGIVTKVTPKFVWMHRGLFTPYGSTFLLKQTSVEKSSIAEAKKYYPAYFNKRLYNTFTKKVDIAA